MGIEHDHAQRPDENWDALERAIASAGRYVRPSDDLRVRVLDAASDEVGRRRAVGRLMLCSLAASLCVTLGATLVNRLPAPLDPFDMPRVEVQVRMTAATGADRASSPDWELVEVVGRWRSELAARLAPRSVD